ncbi:Unknown protein, partial [Striga hermonthica]
PRNDERMNPGDEPDFGVNPRRENEHHNEILTISQEQRGETSASGGRKRTASRRDEEHSVHIPIRRSGPPTRVNTSRESSSVSRSQAEVNRHVPMPTNLIMFSDEDSLPFDNPHSDALVITAPIFRIPVHRIMVDTGAYSSILYWTAFLKMGIDRSELRPCNDRITGFNRQATIPEGEITLPIEHGGSGANERRIMETFKVVKMASKYNAILGRTALYKLKAAVSIFHYSIKFPTKNGTGVHYGNQREARECIMAIPSLEIHSVMMVNEEEKLIVEPVVEPEQSDEQKVSPEQPDNSAAKGNTNERKRVREEPIEGPEEEDEYPMLTSSNTNTPSPPRDRQGEKAVKESEADQSDPNGEQNQKSTQEEDDPCDKEDRTADRGRRPGKEPIEEKDELDPRDQFKGKKSERAEPSKDTETIYLDEPACTKSLRIGRNIGEPIRSRLITFLIGNADVFAWMHEDMVGIDPNLACHSLRVDRTVKPIVQKRRKLGPERQGALEGEVIKLIDNRFVREAKYPVWVSNPVLVKKNSGTWRLCVDFSDLNWACPKDSYPLPSIDYMVDATSGHELMSFMDAYSGYHQIPMDPNDEEHTSFYSARRLYCYTMMPFGLKNAGATYQRLVNKMFADQIGRTMEVYVDDMLVKSVFANDHVSHLNEMFSILRDYSMVLNPKKSTFGVGSGKFLGYIVSQRGIEANPDKIKAILELKPPRSIRETQSLTSRLAALSRFISKSTDKCKPFFEAIKKNKKFEWTDECQHALDNIKESLIRPPVLQKPTPGEMLYLYLGVTPTMISAVLVREENLNQHPIYYTSKALHEAEARYPQIEKLIFALVTASRKLRPYFLEHQVTVLSAYPIRIILHKPDTSGRMIKWAVELGQFDLQYKPRTSIKGQALSDFVAEFTTGAEPVQTTETWEMYIDGSATTEGSGGGVVIVSPQRKLYCHSVRY